MHAQPRTIIATSTFSSAVYRLADKIRSRKDVIENFVSEGGAILNSNNSAKHLTVISKDKRMIMLDNILFSNTVSHNVAALN